MSLEHDLDRNIHSVRRKSSKKPQATKTTMAYNPRMSTVRPTPNSKTRTKQQEEDNFMTLSEREIAGCISDIGINFSVADLQKPNPQLIQKVFEWFAELLMNTTRDVVSPSMKAAADDIGGQYSDIFSADTRDLLGFFTTLRKLLAECGIHDLTLQDLYRPTCDRLVKIFSYVINFIRFRESQTTVMDEHFNKSEKTKQRIEQLYSENQQKEDTLSDLERNRKNAEAAIKDKEARSNDLKNRLLELKRGQERVSEKLERAREEQGRLKRLLEDKTANTMTTRQEVQKLRPYTTQPRAELEASLDKLDQSLNDEKAEIESLERRSRALQTSTDAFNTVTSDVQSCTSLLHDLSRDLAAEEATLAGAAKNRDALSERSNNVRDIERQERQLQKQLENVLEKTEKSRQKADERRQGESRKMEELKGVNEQLKRERAESGREMEKRRVRIEQTEKKMADLKENIENEIHTSHDEYLKMESHIRLYIKEMEGSIAV